MTTNNFWAQRPIILVYTMTDGLGDYLIMGDVMRKAKRLLRQSNCLMVHRANTHVKQWPDCPYKDIFYNIYSPVEMLNITMLLAAKRRQGCVVFGLQMSPGSLEGLVLHRCLKFAGAMDYVVDFNLINADLITFTQDNYILDRQLNQLRDLFKINIPSDFYRLQLPLPPMDQKSVLKKNAGRRLVGIHPWSRRATDSFFWPLNKWVEVIRSLLHYEDIDFVIFGKDQQFESFTNSLRNIFPDSLSRFYFVPSTSVSDFVQTIADLEIVLTVNTSVVHIGYAFDKKMVVLTGSSLDLWNPIVNKILLVTDTQALFKGVDRSIKDKYFPQVARIEVQQVLHAFDSL